MSPEIFSADQALEELAGHFDHWRLGYLAPAEFSNRYWDSVRVA